MFISDLKGEHGLTSETKQATFTILFLKSGDREIICAHILLTTDLNFPLPVSEKSLFAPPNS